MCGIAGLLSPAEGPSTTRAELESMIGTLRHRGPDATGYHIDGRIGLAHARLSIIDLDTGDQPQGNEDGTVYLTFNGEIFNYRELRHTLQGLGHRFRTASDTETIIHAYEAWGLDCVHHLDGQFAFALWDAGRRRLVLARDRTGIRPLYWTRIKGRLAFASEVKALRAVLPAGLDLDLQGIAQVYALWANTGTQTVFRGVSSLPPGHLMTVDDAGERLHRYWTWAPTDADAAHHTTLASAGAALRERLIDAVKLQLRADVPVGAYLSGGLDSSGIAALVRHATDTPLQTFSVTFDDAEFDEGPAQQEMVRHLGTTHTSVRCRTVDIGNLFPHLIRHTESPVLRTAPVPLMILARHVREAGFKVVLTGEGADEVFGGYDLFKEAMVRRFWARQPDSACRPALLSRLYPYLKHSPVARNRMALGFYADGLTDTADPFYAHRPRWQTTARLARFFSADVRRLLEGCDPLDELRQSLPGDFSRRTPLQRDQYVEAWTLLAGYLLTSQGDRVAMAHSVEGRFPFLDHRVVEFGCSLRPHLKIRGLHEKRALREALRPFLPETVCRRTKQPYRAPDSQSFFSNGQPLDYVAALMSPAHLRQSGLFDVAPVVRLFEKCRAGRAIGFGDNMAFVGILSTLLLKEQLA